MMMLMAMLIIIVPEILVAFVAASIFIIGIGVLSIGHMVRKSKTDVRNIDEWFLKTDHYGRWFARVPSFRIRYRKF